MQNIKGLPVIALAISLFGLAAVMVLYLAGFIRPADAMARDRVAGAGKSKDARVRELAAAAGLSYPMREIFIRHVKLEQELEVWGRSQKDQPFKKVATYHVCARSGTLGPKRREGDRQVPEGVYEISGFNPASSYHLSMRVNYPNQSDRILSDKNSPGGDIFIHGNCVTIGCIPIQDDPVEELYIMSQDSVNKSGVRPVVHIFPCRMDSEECRAALAKASRDNPDLKTFWADLEKIYAWFERTKTVPVTVVNKDGGYLIKP